MAAAKKKTEEMICVKKSEWDKLNEYKKYQLKEDITDSFYNLDDLLEVLSVDELQAFVDNHI